MIVSMYNKKEVKDKPGLYAYAGEVRGVYTLEEIENVKADKKDLAPENDSDREIIKELERQGRIGNDSPMYP